MRLKAKPVKANAQERVTNQMISGSAIRVKRVARKDLFKVKRANNQTDMIANRLVYESIRQAATPVVLPRPPLNPNQTGQRVPMTVPTTHRPIR